jgi:hypothetical protein
MSAATALAGGFAASLVLALALVGAAQAGLTRLDLLLLLGSVAPLRAAGARAAGLSALLIIGMAVALAYPPVLESLGWRAWWQSAALGAAHGVLAVLLLGVLGPVTHPRLRDRPGRTRLERPGAALERYGSLSAPVLIGAHVLYGAVLGAFVTSAPG